MMIQKDLNFIAAATCALGFVDEIVDDNGGGASAWRSLRPARAHCARRAQLGCGEGVASFDGDLPPALCSSLLRMLLRVSCLKGRATRKQSPQMGLNPSLFDADNDDDDDDVKRPSLSLEPTSCERVLRKGADSCALVCIFLVLVARVNRSDTRWPSC